jgi:putative SOS response-associated peptidase YedK
VPYKNKADRKYTNAAKYEAQPEQVKNRVARNAARSKLTKAGKVSKGDGKDVAHVKAFDKGGSNKNGVRVESAAKNRSFKRDSKRNLVSETSTRERKKK